MSTLERRITIDPHLPPTPTSADIGIEFADFIGDSVTRTTENNPLARKADTSDLISTHKGMAIFIYRELGMTTPIELARKFRITERATARYLKTGSHSGGEKGKRLVQTTEQVFAITKILVDHFPSLQDRIGSLKAPNSKFETSADKLIEEGYPDRALALVEHAFRDVHEQS